jgi:hypothetical protein
MIYDFIAANKSNSYSGRFSFWNELLLEIAQKEKDVPGIRKIAWGFIENSFDSKYYRIYKSTFSAEEWTNEPERIITYYEKKKKSFTNSVADVLVVEKAAEKLMKYIEQHLSIEKLENYYTGFASSFPDETLALFRRVIDPYAESNTGRNHYEYIAGLFKKMIKIKGGQETVTNMINQYQIRYKNRRVMIEILSHFSK